MTQPEIRSAFVADRGVVDMPRAVETVDALVGQEITAGGGRLSIERRIGEGFAGSTWFAGKLHTTPFMPPVRVDVVVTPWSSTQTEIGLRPLTASAQMQSLRLTRFFRAAWPIVDALVERAEQAQTSAGERPAAAALKIAA